MNMKEVYMSILNSPARPFRAAILAFVVVGFSIASAQSDPARATVEGYVSAQHKLDWTTVASYFEPADLAEFKQMFQGILAGVAAQLDTSVVKPSYFGKKSLSELPAVDSVTYFAGIFKMMFELYPQMREMATSASDTVLGSVNEGDDMKHFVCRVKVKVQQENMSNIEVVSAHKVGSKWYIMGKRSMEQMATLLKRTMR
ncbi:MAG: hypothetical protein WBP42_09575 [Candidatus Zixiibacteriota bacterium]